MGHQDHPHLSPVGQLQKLDGLPGGAGVGEKEDGVPLGEGGRRNDLHVGVAQGEKAHPRRGKEMGCLLSHNHGAALAQTEHFVRLGEDIRRL